MIESTSQTPSSPLRSRSATNHAPRPLRTDADAVAVRPELPSTFATTPSATSEHSAWSTEAAAVGDAPPGAEAKAVDPAAPHVASNPV